MGVFDRISGLTGAGSEAEPSDEAAGEPTPAPEDPATMDRIDFRDRAEELAGRSNVPTLDFTVESLEKLDGLVDGPSRPVDDPAIYGSYLGEVLVRVFDGSWLRNDGWAVEVEQDDDGTTVAVFDAARMAIERRPVFRDVVAKLESNGATRIAGQPPAHREIDAATSAPSVDDEPTETKPDDEPAEAAEDADGETNAAGDGAVPAADTEAEPAAPGASGEENALDADADESNDPVDEPETDAEGAKDDTDDAGAKDETNAGDATGSDEAPPERTDDGDERTVHGDFEFTGRNAAADASDADAVDDGPDVADEGSERDVTVDETGDDGEVADVPGAEGEGPATEPGAEAPDETDAASLDETTAGPTAGADGVDGPSEQTPDGENDRDEDQPTGADIISGDAGTESSSDDGSENAEPVDESAGEPDAIEPADGDPESEPTDERASDAAGTHEEAGENEGDGGLGVISRIAHLAASWRGPSAVTSATDEQDGPGEGAAVDESAADDETEADDSPITETAVVDESGDDDTDPAADADGDVATRAVDDVFDVGGERADSTAIIPAILDRAEGVTDDWPAADLDYSPGSLERLDDLVAREFDVSDRANARLGETTDADSPRFTEHVTGAAAYYAAVLVSHLDANWHLEDDVRLVVEGPDGSHTVDPVAVATGAIRGDDSTARHFERLADRVGREVATPD